MLRASTTRSTPWPTTWRGWMPASGAWKLAPHEAAAPSPHSDHRPALRAGGILPRPRAGQAAALAGARDAVLAAARGAARRAAAARAGGTGPDLRQVRADALDPPRPGAARHCRRTRAAAGPRAAVPVGR